LRVVKAQSTVLLYMSVLTNGIYSSNEFTEICAVNCSMPNCQAACPVGLLEK
jgi:hypothetical protein